MSTISFIVPTLGRPSLVAALKSIVLDPGDEIIVVGTIPPGITSVDRRPTYIVRKPGGDWGARERTLGMAFATKQYVAFLDDDDTYAPDAREAMREGLAVAQGRPAIFRMRYPSGRELWNEAVLKMGNVGTPMMVVPNDSAKLGRWSSRRECDYDFLASGGWSQADIAWSTAIVALIGHND